MLDHKTQNNIKSSSRPNSLNSTPTKQQKMTQKSISMKSLNGKLDSQ